MDRIVRWTPIGSFGAEQLRLRSTESGYVAESMVIGDGDGTPYALTYRIVCDGTWRVREVSLVLLGGTRDLHLHALGNGDWTDGDGQLIEALHGCVDIDIAATPFTNTLPIRRLMLRPGEARRLRVVYLAIPSLTPQPSEQRYTCLEQHAIYRFEEEGLFRGFTADLAVDEDGLVLDYPGLFRRHA